MSGLINSTLNGSASNLSEGIGRSLSSSFSVQSGAGSSIFNQPGNIQGQHSIHGFNIPNIGSRSSTMNSIPSGVQQAADSLSNGRFSSNNLPISLSQISHSSGNVHSGLSNRGGMGVTGNQGYGNSSMGVGGSIPGVLQPSASFSNRTSVPGLGVSPSLGNAGSRISGSMGNVMGAGGVGRNISSGGLSMSELASRLSFTGNSGTGNPNVQGQNRLMGNVLQQASPQVLSMLSNSYHNAGGSVSQNHMQAVNNRNSLGMLNDMNSNDSAPFDINDFPQLGRPSSSGGPQGQMGSLRKQGLGPIVQQNQEFSIQNEDFPALPGFKGGNGEYSMDQLNDMQAQQFSVGRSSGFNLGQAYSSHRPQQHQHASSGGPFLSVTNQDLLHLQGSDMFPSSNSNYHAQSSGPPGIGLRPMNSQSSASGIGYEQLLKQYQNQNQSQFHLQQQNLDQRMNILQQTSPHLTYDKFGLLGLKKVLARTNPDLSSLALGIDLTTLGLNLNSTETLYKTFGSPWSDEPAKGDPEFTIPQCYIAKQSPPLNQTYFSKFQLDTLFYVFYSMPKDEAQLYAANELYNRGWFYHKENRLWYTRATKTDLIERTSVYERGSYICFDPNGWETIRKDNFVVQYEMLEKRPVLPQH